MIRGISAFNARDCKQRGFPIEQINTSRETLRISEIPRFFKVHCFSYPRLIRVKYKRNLYILTHINVSNDLCIVSLSVKSNCIINLSD